MGRLSWLFGGNDHQLAADRYAGRESATDRAARRGRTSRSKTFGKPSRTARDADRQGQAWENGERQRHSGTAWWRGQG
jgi:hypothetical protein